MDQEVVVNWNHQNKEYYESLGYVFSGKYKTKLKVSVFDLPKGSHMKVQLICDYCGKKFPRIYKNHTRQQNSQIIEKDCCSECSHIKSKETLIKKYNVEKPYYIPGVKDKIRNTTLERYGVENVLMLPEIQEKRKQTNIEKYGAECIFSLVEFREQIKLNYIEKYGFINPLLNDEIKEKARKTNIERYGVENPFQNEKIKEKIKKTNLEKYGVEYVLQSEEVKNKSKITSLKKYGTEYPSQSEEIREKITKTLYREGTQKTSTQQKYLHKVIGGELNYPVSRCSLDIAFPEENIYIECDFSGHDLKVRFEKITKEDFEIQERKREMFLYNRGWRRIRIISKNDKVPLEEKILEMIDYAKDYLNLDHSWIEFNLNESKITCSQFEKYYDFGKLRKVKKSDIEEGDAIDNAI